MQRNDCVLEALGSGQYNDLLHKYYKDNGAVSPQINDAEYEFLIAQGVVGTDHLNDMWFELLSSLGYSGSLSDMQHEFWCVDGGAVIPPEPDVPSGYNFSWVTDPITESPTSINVIGAEVGADYQLTVSGIGGSDVIKTGTVSYSSFFIHDIDVSEFDDGVINGSLTLTNGIGEGLPVSYNVIKDIDDIEPPGDGLNPDGSPGYNPDGSPIENP